MNAFNVYNNLLLIIIVTVFHNVLITATENAGADANTDVQVAFQGKKTYSQIQLQMLLQRMSVGAEINKLYKFVITEESEFKKNLEEELEQNPIEMFENLMETFGLSVLQNKSIPCAEHYYFKLMHEILHTANQKKKQFEKAWKMWEGILQFVKNTVKDGNDTMGRIETMESGCENDAKKNECIQVKTYIINFFVENLKMKVGEFPHALSYQRFKTQVRRAIRKSKSLTHQLLTKNKGFYNSTEKCIELKWSKDTDVQNT